MTTYERLFYLVCSSGRTMSVAPDGTDPVVLVDEGCGLPDGIAVDVDAGHLYWTNMGNPKSDDGEIVRCNLDGSELTRIIPPGVTFTPKQIQIEPVSRMLYWSDREGMRVMRCNLDGSGVETLVDTSQGDVRPGPDPTRWCVGMAVDPVGGHIYWTQKGGDNAGQGRILRVPIQMAPGETASDRLHVEVLYDHLPEPIDLEIDHGRRILYWTDRGDPPRGNTVCRAPLDVSGARPEPEILVSHLMEGIGVAIDERGERLFVTDFGGNLISATLDGKESKTLVAAGGNLTGIAFARLPVE